MRHGWALTLKNCFLGWGQSLHLLQVLGWSWYCGSWDYPLRSHSQRITLLQLALHSSLGPNMSQWWLSSLCFRMQAWSSSENSGKRLIGWKPCCWALNWYVAVTTLPYSNDGWSCPLNTWGLSYSMCSSFMLLCVCVTRGAHMHVEVRGQLSRLVLSVHVGLWVLTQVAGLAEQVLPPTEPSLHVFGWQGWNKGRRMSWFFCAASDELDAFSLYQLLSR